MFLRLLPILTPTRILTSTPLNTFSTTTTTTLPPITIYGTQFCGPCNKAKKYLTQNSIKYEFINTQQQPYLSEVLELKKKHNWKTIPLIFVKGQFVGGFSDLMEKIGKGEINIKELK